MKTLLVRARTSASKICISDRFLMLFMLILMVYTAAGLFFGASFYDDGTSVDTVVRTSAAAIFGYFISSNFTSSATSDSIKTYGVSQSTSSQAAAGILSEKQIGFVTNSASSDEAGKATAAEYSVTPPSLRLQTGIAFAVGIFSLLLLIAARLFLPTASLSSAAAAQLRDFVSACVGFLVSCKRSK